MNAMVQYQMNDMERIARAFASSKLFGVQNVEQALALCLVAQAEGRHPASAAQDYHIIQGRPAKKTDAMLRDFIAGGGKVEWHMLDDKIADATFSHPSGGAARIDWTMARATQAGLTTPMWKKYPRQMLRARCVSEGVRTVFPMATSGMYVPEEVAEFEPVSVAPQETVEAAPAPATPQPAIKRLTSSRAKEIGLDDKLKDLINVCMSEASLDQFEANFDKLTAEAPLSWLDSIHNHALLRREEIRAEQANGAMDAEFKAVMA